MTACVRGLRARGDAGITLVELIVAIAITAILATLVVGSLVSVARTLTKNTIATSSAGAASMGMRELTRVIRSSTEIPVKSAANLPVFIDAGALTLTLHAFVDSDSTLRNPVRIQFTLTATGDLVEKRWAATKVLGFWTFGSTATSQRVVARGIVAIAATSPIFTYVDTDGVALVVPAGGVLTASQVANITAVKIRLTAQSDTTGKIAPVSLTNTVGISNLDSTRTDVAP